MAPTITEEQKQLLQQTALENGMNAWDYVLSEKEADQPWAIAGILWEARNLRYAQSQMEDEI